MIVQGTILEGVLETAMSTALPGAIRAVLSEDVLSYDRASVLLPRGTRLIGTYSADVRIAQRRALVAWNRAITPEGTSVALGGVGADALGQSGEAGHVDKHFWSASARPRRAHAPDRASLSARQDQGAERRARGRDQQPYWPKHPLVSGGLTAFGQSLRVQIVVPPAVARGASISIRKYVSRILDLGEIAFLMGQQVSVEARRLAKLHCFGRRNNHYPCERAHISQRQPLSVRAVHLIATGDHHGFGRRRQGRLNTNARPRAGAQPPLRAVRISRNKAFGITALA